MYRKASAEQNVGEEARELSVPEYDPEAIETYLRPSSIRFFG